MKRYLDFNRRPWKIWFMDASKQGFSAGFMHVFNLVAAVMIDSMHEDTNGCVWYFISLIIDVFLGTAICFLLLLGTEQCLKYSPRLHYTSGFYGVPTSWRSWLYQTVVWLLIVLVMKTTVIGVVITFRIPLTWAGETLLSPLLPFPQLELLFVMIIIPLVMNSLSFWVTDSFLKCDYEDFMEYEVLLHTESSCCRVETFSIDN